MAGFRAEVDFGDRWHGLPVGTDTQNQVVIGRGRIVTRLLLGGEVPMGIKPMRVARGRAEALSAVGRRQAGRLRPRWLRRGGRSGSRVLSLGGRRGLGRGAVALEEYRGYFSRETGWRWFCRRRSYGGLRPLAAGGGNGGNGCNHPARTWRRGGTFRFLAGSRCFRFHSHATPVGGCRGFQMTAILR